VTRWGKGLLSADGSRDVLENSDYGPKATAGSLVSELLGIRFALSTIRMGWMSIHAPMFHKSIGAMIMNGLEVF